MQLTAEDFDMLTEQQMQFKGQDWEIQNARFSTAPNYEHEYIYWVTNQAELVLATKYLQQQGFDYQTNYDLKFDQPFFTTNYAGSWVTA
jgi:hypothetical protein